MWRTWPNWEIFNYFNQLLTNKSKGKEAHSDDNKYTNGYIQNYPNWAVLKKIIKEITEFLLISLIVEELKKEVK